MSPAFDPTWRLATNRAGAVRPLAVTPRRLDEVVAGLAGLEPAAGEVRVSDVCLDSRSAGPGDLFVALPGEHTHGARYAAQAVAQGAGAVLTDAAGAEAACGLGVPVAVATDLRAAMARAACRLFGDPTRRLLMLGITGTNGKTTSMTLAAAGLSGAGRRVGTIGTLGFALAGVPLPATRTTVTTPESPDLQGLFAAMADSGADTGAMEVSSHALALDRVAGIRFDVVGFTNLGRDHLDFHHTMEAYFEAKATLFVPGRSAVAVINADDAAGRRLIDRVRAAGAPALVTFGFDPGADYRILSWRPDGGGVRFDVAHEGVVRTLRLGLPGEYNVRNAVLALAMIEAAGLDGTRAADGMATASVPGRMQRVELGEGAPHVYVDFAHTPQAVAAAVGAVPEPRVVVVGSGGDRDPDKRGPIGAAAAGGARLVIVTDDNPRTEDPARVRAGVLAGARAAAAPGHEVVEIAPREAAIAEALRRAEPGASVLVLGKGHETTQQMADGVHPFSDAEAVRAAWARQIAGTEASA